MQLTIEISGEAEARLRKRAADEGVSAEELSRRTLEIAFLEPLNGGESPDPGALAEQIAGIWADASDEELEDLPKGGLDHIDHYVYGTPKREP